MEPCRTCDSSTPSILLRNPIPSPAPKQIDPVSVEYDDKWEKWNAHGQLKWATLMEEGDYKNPSLYRKVKVLLISWDEESDDLKTKSEVRCAEDLVETKLTTVRLTSLRMFSRIRSAFKSPEPSSIINDEHIAKSISNETPKIPIDLMLLFGIMSSAPCRWLKPTFLRSLTGRQHYRNGMLLAKEQGKFTVSQLATAVRAAPNFPEDQVPVLFERGASIERIVLAPLSDKNADQDSASSSQDDPTERQSQGLLTLNFVFETPPSDHHLEKIAHALKKIIHQKVPIKQVVWGGSHRSPSAHSIMIQAANKFTTGIAVRRRQAKLKEESFESLPLPDSLAFQGVNFIADQEGGGEGGAPHARKRRSRTASLDQAVLGSNANPSRARRRVYPPDLDSDTHQVYVAE
ncbi:MAG: hypothetical protein Q9187_002765 [Circinaria calcarea]